MIYLHDWAENNWQHLKGEAAMKADFKIGDKELDGAHILLATYHDENYSGQAFVLFVRDGKLYEVNASHCSCYGLEDQWRPEETTFCALKHRMKSGHLGDDHNGGYFKTELATVLAVLEAASTVREEVADTPRRFFLGSDESGHRYIVPVEKREEWKPWSEGETSDPAPSWSKMVGGKWTFTDPQTAS